MPAAKAKAGDRAQGVLDALAERERSFACCFEAWLDATAESEVRITLRIVLEPAGMVRSAELVHRPEAPLDVRAVQCLEHVASTIEFPASPAGRETVVEYPLRVKRGTSTQGD
ncbi:MAG: hypothetical protein EXR75_07455 [Myxococcales bacterium]|nr:hypothetical protein [Myxococcales bacterium]